MAAIPRLWLLGTATTVGLAILGGAVTTHSLDGVTILAAVARKHRSRPVNTVVAAYGTSPLQAPEVLLNGVPLAMAKVSVYPQASPSLPNLTVWLMDAPSGAILKDGDTIEVHVSNAEGEQGVYHTYPCKSYFKRWVACYAKPQV